MHFSLLLHRFQSVMDVDLRSAIMLLLSQRKEVSELVVSLVCVPLLICLLTTLEYYSFVMSFFHLVQYLPTSQLHKYKLLVPVLYTSCGLNRTSPMESSFPTLYFCEYKTH